jgi:hypothetical protein
MTTLAQHNEVARTIIRSNPVQMTTRQNDTSTRPPQATRRIQTRRQGPNMLPTRKTTYKGQMRHTTLLTPPPSGKLQLPGDLAELATVKPAVFTSHGHGHTIHHVTQRVNNDCRRGGPHQRPKDGRPRNVRAKPRHTGRRYKGVVGVGRRSARPHAAEPRVAAGSVAGAGRAEGNTRRSRVLPAAVE